MPFAFPQPLYPIADDDSATDVVALAAAILAGGARLLQLRVKQGPTGRFVELARGVQALAQRSGARLIINDRVDIAVLIGAAGVHLGQTDLPPAAARVILGPEAIIGCSTHDLDQVDAALAAGAIDYLAFGPIFATASKRNPDPVQGIDTLRAVRRRCGLPLVAIGGITAASAAAVLDAGADAVALIGAVAHAGDPAAAVGELLTLTARRSPLRS